MEEIYYSFVLVIYNQWKLVQQTVETLIESIESRTVEKGIEIILIDNGSADGHQPWLMSIMSNMQSNFVIRLFCLEKNFGYPIGSNFGLSKCRGEIITLLNTDLIFTKGWFEPLVKILEASTDIGVSAPYLSKADGIQNVQMPMGNETKSFIDAYMKKHESDITLVDRIIGACMVIKREVIRKVGGYDFWFGIGHYEDDDLCLRIRIAGYKIALVGGSLVQHIGSASFAQLDTPIYSFVESNREKFLRKWSMVNIFSDRDEMIKKTRFIKKCHYIPIVQEYKTKNFRTREKQRWLIVADWNNKHSPWRERIIAMNNKQIHCQLWIPKEYFESDKIFKEALCYSKKIDYMMQSIIPSRLLEFVDTYNGLVSIENDFVNQYIITLGEQLNKCIE